MRFSFRGFIRSIPFLFSLAALAALYLYNDRSLYEIILLLMLVGVSSFFVCYDKAYYINCPPRLKLYAVITSLGMGCIFCIYMKNSSKIIALAHILGLNNVVVLCALAVVGALVGQYALAFLFNYIRKNYYEYIEIPDVQVNMRQTKDICLLCVLFAGVTLTICSKCSPLYPFNDWVDSNCFMTVGRGMLKGLVPYRDLYEQKGPLLYMMHALSGVLSYKSFLGVFPLEIIAAAAFIYIGYLIMGLYKKREHIYVYLCVLALVVYSSKSFCSGDSAEEFCLPILAYALYCAIRAIKEKHLPTNIQCLFVGIGSACVLWIKYSMLGFYIGWFAALLAISIRDGQIQTLLKRILFIILGVALVSVPIVFYFQLNGALNDLWQVYFFDNIFRYTDVSNAGMFALAYNLVQGIGNMMHDNIVSLLLIVAAILALLKSGQTDMLLLFVCSAVGLFLSVYSGGRFYTYYALIFSVYIPLGLVAISSFVEIISIRLYQNKSIGLLITCIACIVFCFIMSPNTFMIGAKRQDMPQYQFAELMEQDASLLNYGGLDGGFYTASGKIPNCRFFCNLNMPLPDIMNTQNRYIDEGLVDYIVTTNNKLDAEKYTLIAEARYQNASFPYGERRYYLYGLNQ